MKVILNANEAMDLTDMMANMLCRIDELELENKTLSSKNRELTEIAEGQSELIDHLLSELNGEEMGHEVVEIHLDDENSDEELEAVISAILGGFRKESQY
ncbi:hypothetical protein [Endozoicomonas sp. ALB032]|uniref:hypothetical protein n=1 Tax=Endozoicomonas sp. ALB032 TaxID=3403082 RepID=UPI003BB6C356